VCCHIAHNKGMLLLLLLLQVLNNTNKQTHNDKRLDYENLN